MIDYALTRNLIRKYALLTRSNFHLAFPEELSSGGPAGEHYVDMRSALLQPDCCRLVADNLLEMMRDERAVSVGGLAVGAVPLVTAVCLRSLQTHRYRQGFFVRRDVTRHHGLRRRVEGNPPGWGQEALVLEDVVTTGNSVLTAVRAVREGGCEVRRAYAVVDREEGAREALLDEDVELRALFTLDELR